MSWLVGFKRLRNTPPASAPAFALMSVVRFLLSNQGKDGTGWPSKQTDGIGRTALLDYFLYFVHASTRIFHVFVVICTSDRGKLQVATIFL
jgi:hypothetical protein